MKTQEVQFGGNNYPCRVVESESKSEASASKEAERIYDEVFFFTDMANLRLTDVELVAELKKDNPEWFE